MRKLDLALKITALFILILVAFVMSQKYVFRPIYNEIKTSACIRDAEKEQLRRTEIDIAAKVKYDELINSGVYKEPQEESTGSSWTPKLSESDSRYIYRTYRLVDLRKEIGPDIAWESPFSLENTKRSCEE